MSRPKLRSPSQPLPVRLVLGVYEFLASLKLAVVTILAAAFVLGWGTFVESKYGLRGVHFSIWQSGWFAAINALLAVNIFCAASIRFPWKRHQTGFVITHIGLLTLMAGYLMSHLGAIDAQMPVFEGGTNHYAVLDSQHIVVEIEPEAAQASGAADPPVTLVNLDGADAQPASTVTVPLRFEGGPFNWADYDRENWLPMPPAEEGQPTRLFWFPWGLPFRGVPPADLAALRAHGVELEVLDYYSDAEEIGAPLVKLKINTPRMERPGPDGRMRKSPEVWVPVQLAIEDRPRPPFDDRPFGLGTRRETGGGALVFWMAGSDAETKAFLDCRPEGKIGPKGQLILHAADKRFTIDVAEKAGEPAFPLGDTGLTAEVVRFYATADIDRAKEDDGLHLIETSPDGKAELPVVEVDVRQEDDPPQRIVLFADRPELSVQDHANQVFGTYWFDHGEISTQDLLAGKGTSRIDIIQGTADGRLALYYRYWNRKEVVFARALPPEEPVDAFKMPIAQLQLKVDQHIARATPGPELLPLPFNKDTVAGGATRAARLRVTVDGRTEEFWLKGPPPDPLERPLEATAQRTIQGKGRTVRLTMPLDQFDLGFRVRLDKFERRLDPGTSQASHYGSVVDLLHRDDDREFSRNVQISMNAPIDFSAPTPDGGRSRSYRLFQESFHGPFKPGDPIYEMRLSSRDSTDRPEQLFISVLTVNYDPGRGIKYLGCGLVVLGICTMFYMRAYFFKPKAKPAAE
jgi:hypothetical protein